MRLSRNNGANAKAEPEGAAERLRAFLRARGLRMTGEREALVRAALGRRRHFTLEELVERVVGHDTRASRATVYRGLPILIEAGILQPVLVSDEPRRFELAFGRRHHDHLLCRRCGRVVEFRSSAIEEAQLAVAARHGFRLTSHVHELVGDCAACRRARRAERPRGVATNAGRRRAPAGRAGRRA
jgi:Fur family ferric uptake transcriptional regulator